MNYDTSSETIRVLTGKRKQIAQAKRCDDSYIRHIASGGAKDPFPPFKQWFRECAAGGGNVRVYINSLLAIEQEHRTEEPPDLMDAVARCIESTGKLNAYIVASGALGRFEANEVLRTIPTVRRSVDDIERVALMSI